MHDGKKHQIIEGGFLVALLAMCVVLTTLQSRWTSNLGLAATRQQTTQLRSQAQMFCRAFDSQFSDACAQLRPNGKQIESLGRNEAHAQSLQRWQSGKPQPMFRRLAVIVPEAGSARLYLLDQKTAQLTAAAWPPEWNALQANLTRRIANGVGHPFDDPSGLVREYPIFGDSAGAGRAEIEWMIMELDPSYVRKTWLPELARTYINPGREILNDLSVKTRSSPPRTIFSSSDGGQVGAAPVLVGLNIEPRGGPMDDDPEKDALWILYTWPRADGLAAAVSNARAHDFALACLLDAALLFGGLLIVHYARRARRLGDARMHFVAAVSHELRTPLTVMRAVGQNMRRGLARDPERCDQYGGMIIEHSDQLIEMVEQVLSFAGAKRNETRLTLKPVAVTQVVQEAIAACALDTEAAGCRIQATVEGDPPPVLGDAQALQRAIQNLLTNAAKHGGQGQWIGVQTRYVNGSLPGRVEVEVTDRGEGIPPREQAHVFEPFFRGVRAREEQTRGSGIGLSVVQEIVKAHQGSVQVESQLGRGTVFTVSLPVAHVGKPASV